MLSNNVEPRITISNREPMSNEGKDGDIWFVVPKTYPINYPNGYNLMGGIVMVEGLHSTVMETSTGIIQLDSQTNAVNETTLTEVEGIAAVKSNGLQPINYLAQVVYEGEMPRDGTALPFMVIDHNWNGVDKTVDSFLTQRKIVVSISKTGVVALYYVKPDGSANYWDEITKTWKASGTTLSLNPSGRYKITIAKDAANYTIKIIDYNSGANLVSATFLISSVRNGLQRDNLIVGDYITASANGSNKHFVNSIWSFSNLRFF